jgi:dUTP pyrophosphatase
MSDQTKAGPFKGIRADRDPDGEGFVLGFDFRGSVRFKRCGDVEVPVPSHQSAGAAGLDLCAAIRQPITIGSCQRQVIPTGWALALPACYYAEVRSRSGLAVKHGLTVLTGTIDADYRGEVSVVLVNLSREFAEIRPRERIAQLVVMPYVTVSPVVVAELPATARGAQGFGSTGRG